MGTFCNATWQADENFCGSNCGTSLTSLSVCGRLHSPPCRRKTRRDVKGKSRGTRGRPTTTPCTHCIPWQIIMPNLASPTWPLGSWSHLLFAFFAQCAIPKVFYPYICTYVFATFDINIFWFYNFKFSRKGSLIYRTLMATINAKLYIKPNRKCVSTSDFNNIFENDGKHKGGGKLRWRQMLSEPKTNQKEG